MNFAAFLLLLGILGIVVGVLNKGFRVISFFVALLALVLLVGAPNSRGNFFTNLFNPRPSPTNTTTTFNTETGQTQTTTAPNPTNGSRQPNGTPLGSSTGTGAGVTGTTTGTTGTGTSGSTTGTGTTGTGIQSAPFTTAPTSTTSRRPRALW